MALIPGSRYPAQTDSAAGYPQGKARNAGSFQDGTGTPLEKDWINDVWGFLQSLLANASITPDGNPDQVGASQYLEGVTHIAQAAVAAPIAAKSVLANATNGPAAPTGLSGAEPRYYYRVTGANTGLEVAPLADAVQTSVTPVSATSFLLATTGTYTIPANTLQVGSRFICEYTYRFTRGATATPFNLNSRFVVAGTAHTAASASETAAGNYDMMVRAALTILTIGASGTAMLSVSAMGTAISDRQAGQSNTTVSIDTTQAIAIVGQAHMQFAVADTSIKPTGGHIMQVN